MAKSRPAADNRPKRRIFATHFKNNLRSDDNT
jgi:hypothetical protein